MLRGERQGPYARPEVRRHGLNETSGLYSTTGQLPGEIVTDTTNVTSTIGVERTSSDSGTTNDTTTS